MASAPEFSKIVRQFGESVYQLSFRILGSREDAREATQDTFMAVHASLPTFAGGSTISTWVYAVTLRVCARYIRKRETVTIVKTNEALADPSPDPEKILEARELSDFLARLIAQLPEREAEVITLFYVEGASYKEISDILQIPEGTVCTALHRGREHLRKFMTRRKRKV